MNELPLQLPPLTPGGVLPIWSGNSFKLGAEQVPILEYNSNNQGWDDNLTTFHEENAGEHHFIDEASREHALQQINQYLTAPNPTILEIGCSSGFLLKAIQQAKPEATLIGSDVVYQPLLALAKAMPSVPLLRFDLQHCPLPDNSFDAVVMLNVLEHIEHDNKALQQVFRILKPGGILIIEVPAGPHLYDVYDKLLQHFRRYQLNSLALLAEQQGFNILKKSHLGFFIYPGFWLIKQKNKRFLKESLALQKQKVAESIRKSSNNFFMKKLMQLELFLGKFISYPVGIRCLLTCIKK